MSITSWIIIGAFVLVLYFLLRGPQGGHAHDGEHGHGGGHGHGHMGGMGGCCGGHAPAPDHEAHHGKEA